MIVTTTIRPRPVVYDITAKLAGTVWIATARCTYENGEQVPDTPVSMGYGEGPCEAARAAAGNMDTLRGTA